MVPNTIYEGPMYETILQHFRPLHPPIGRQPRVESTNELLEIRHDNNPLSLEGYHHNVLGMKTKESIRGQETLATALPDPSSQVNENEYAVIQSPIVKSVPAILGE